MIDPREEGVFARGHLLAASNLPMSRFELLIGEAVPRRETQIILCDDCHGTAERAAFFLDRSGYENVALLDGGVSAWEADGGALFGGINVPGKAFGEYIEQTCQTPSISPRALAERLETAAPTLVLDCRTPGEHLAYCIPGALNCPNGELVLRASEPADPEMLVVTHCSGRTRSIIGAQTLIDTEFDSPVAALANGTMAWELAGLALERGSERQIGWPEARKLRAARMRALGIASRHVVATVDWDTLQAWRSDATRTTYVIDVRTREEFDVSHVRGSRGVPGGQLIQNIDHHLVTRNARIVLVDTDGVRAPVTASWLARMGLEEVCTFSAGPDELAKDDDAAVPLSSIDGLECVDAHELQEALDREQANVIDVRPSVVYRREHVHGAWFISRENLYRDAGNLPAGPLVMVIDDLQYAGLVRADLERLGREVFLLDGGMDAWRRAEGAIQTGLTHCASPPHDTCFRPGDFDDPRAAAREARHYLNWEIGLIDQIAGDPAAPYANG